MLVNCNLYYTHQQTKLEFDNNLGINAGEKLKIFFSPDSYTIG